MIKKAKIVQIKNPKTGLYVRINRERGMVTGHKMSLGPYKGIPIVRRRLSNGKET